MKAFASAMVSGILCLLVSGKKIVNIPPMNMVIPNIRAPKPDPNTVSTSFDCNILVVFYILCNMPTLLILYMKMFVNITEKLKTNMNGFSFDVHSVRSDN